MDRTIMASGLLAVNYGFAVYCFMTEDENSEYKLQFPALLICIVSTILTAIEIYF